MSRRLDITEGYDRRVSSNPLAVGTLHWITPVLISTCFAIARLVTFCTLQRPSRCSRSSARSRQAVSVILSAAIFLLCITQALVYSWDQLQGFEQHDIPQEIQVSNQEGHSMFTTLLFTFPDLRWRINHHMGHGDHKSAWRVQTHMVPLHSDMVAGRST
jgi:hypothetical protein